MTDFWNLEPKTEIVRRPSKEESMANEIRAIEETLFLEHVKIVRDTACFRDVSPADKEPPPEWVESLGKEEAWRKFRVAQSAWLPVKEAPVALAVASRIVTTAIKARATEKQGPRSLNMTVVQISSPMPVFPEQDIET
jgi:hypothetical protein